jgi:5'-nucleotidase
VDKYRALSAPLANAVIGSITADITRTANAAGESALGDVIADAQLAATAPDGFGNAVVAFMNPGGIRTDLNYAPSGGEAPGEVTYGEAFTVQPFGNSLVTMSLTGAQIDTLLEQQWAGQTSPRILQVSNGFEYSWSASAPVGDRVDPATIKINGVTVDPSATLPRDGQQFPGRRRGQFLRPGAGHRPAGRRSGPGRTGNLLRKQFPSGAGTAKPHHTSSLRTRSE